MKPRRSAGFCFTVLAALIRKINFTFTMKILNLTKM
jgi:hypothetical protein